MELTQEARMTFGKELKIENQALIKYGPERECQYSPYTTLPLSQCQHWAGFSDVHRFLA